MGGKKPFVDKLQMIFDKGYYDPANEPDIAYPYLFSYFKGEEWRTQTWPLAQAQRETFHLDFNDWQLLGSVGRLSRPVGAASGE
jgi:putative alpha-1,2-mannosidase